MKRLAIWFVGEAGLVFIYDDKTHWLGNGESIWNRTGGVDAESLALLTTVYRPALGDGTRS